MALSHDVIFPSVRITWIFILLFNKCIGKVTDTCEYYEFPTDCLIFQAICALVFALGTLQAVCLHTKRAAGVERRRSERRLLSSPAGEIADQWSVRWTHASPLLRQFHSFTLHISTTTVLLKPLRKFDVNHHFHFFVIFFLLFCYQCSSI